MAPPKAAPAASAATVPAPAAAHHRPAWRRPGVVLPLLAVAVAGAARALRTSHLAPPFVDGSLPPSWAYWPLLAAVGVLDDLLRNLTPPNLYLWRHLMGHIHTSQLHAVASLGVADALAGGPKSSAALAAEVTACAAAAEADGPAGCAAVASRLTRLLRATSAYGVFAEVGPETWAHTAPSRFLVSNARGQPNSLLHSALLFGGSQFVSIAHGAATVASGESSFRTAHGSEFWSFYEAHPDQHATFDHTMREIGSLGANDVAIASDFPWAGLLTARGGAGGAAAAGGTLVDVGGGLGDMMAHVLTLAGGLPASTRGAVFDLASVTARSRGVWEAASGAAAQLAPASLDAPTRRRAALWPRVSFAAGSFFEPDTIPDAVALAAAASGSGDVAAAAGTDACAAPPVVYALRDIVHDWPDEDVVRMLSALGSRMRGGAGGGGCNVDRLALVARVVVPGSGFVASQGTGDADWLMLANFGTTAGERTRPHFEALLAQSGLALQAAVPVRGWYTVLVAARA
jgi:hypothetical protein